MEQNQEQNDVLKKRAGTLEDVIYCYGLVQESLISCIDAEYRENENIKELVLNDTYLILTNLLTPITSNEMIVSMFNRYNHNRTLCMHKILTDKPSLYSSLIDDSFYEHTRQYLKGMMINLL